MKAHDPGMGLGYLLEVRRLRRHLSGQLNNPWRKRRFDRPKNLHWLRFLH
jgi:hypothetical protein